MVTFTVPMLGVSDMSRREKTTMAIITAAWLIDQAYWMDIRPVALDSLDRPSLMRSMK